MLKTTVFTNRPPLDIPCVTPMLFLIWFNCYCKCWGLVLDQILYGDLIMWCQFVLGYGERWGQMVAFLVTLEGERTGLTMTNQVIKHGFVQKNLLIHIVNTSVKPFYILLYCFKLKWVHYGLFKSSLIKLLWLLGCGSHFSSVSTILYKFKHKMIL